MEDHDPTINRVIRALRAIPSHAAFSAEPALHDGIAEALKGAGLAFEHEARMGARDRLDFRVGAIAIEAKVAGALSAVTRQLHRYASRPGIEAVVLVTTRSAHRNLPETMCSVPLHVVYVNPLGGL